jgi:hypothetical protein
MTGHEDNRNVDTGLGELDLKLQSAHARQSDVEHQAARLIGEAALKQFGRGAEHLHLQVH